MTTQINQLTELTSTSDGDLLLIREASTGVDKKIQAQNLRAKATTKDDVGLGDVDNVSAASLRDRSTHTGTQPLSTISDAGTIASQDANNVNIDGGTIDGATIGGTTASTGAFTNLAYTGTLTGGTGVVNLGSGQVVKDASGNVGINVTPTSTLSVSGNVRAGNLPSGDGTTTIVSGLGLHIGTNAGATTSVQTPLQMSAFPASPTFTNTPPQALVMSGWTGGIIGHNAIINRGGRDLSFHTNVPTITFSDSAERMRITSAGNVGIGTTSPAPFTGNGATLQLSGASTTSEIRLTRGNGSDVTILAGSTSGGGVLQTNNSTPLRFGTDNTERMRIDSAGNVGIGTTSPSEKLDVAGGIKVSGPINNGNTNVSISSNSTETLFTAPSGGAYLVTAIRENNAADRVVAVVLFPSTGGGAIANIQQAGNFSLSLNGNDVELNSTLGFGSVARVSILRIR